jgi:hypothetical protein
VSRWRFVASFVFWIVVATMLVGFALFRTQSSASCESASRLLQAGRLQEAEKDFLSLVRSQPEMPCTSKGLTLVLQAQCQAGRQMLQLGALDAAARDFQAVVDTAPGAHCGIDGLASVSSEECERLAALAVARSDLARASAEDIVSKTPGASLFGCATNELSLLPSPAASSIP